MASSSQKASASPTSSDPCWKYDVFLSFRGPDTRKGIAVDIYDGLNRRGIKTFMDDPDLQVGDAISPTLIAAIKESRFAIVVLSQNYASSTWCLEELREICLSMEDNRIFVRDFDMEKFQLAKHFRFPWPVNHTSLSPNGKLLVIVGDNPDGMLVDSQTGETVTAFSGHLDYSFASTWHPDGVTFATGNQDKTCRVWDFRNLSKSVAVLKGNLGAIRSIRYTSDGRYMMMAEPADFVHVYDVNSGYEKEQEIDFFGEISGVSFSPDTESLFIGVCDRKYASLLEYGLLNSAA